jgi:hypothetical protein
MKRSTIKHLGDRLREAMAQEDDKGSEEIRKLVETLERRERELSRLRTKPGKAKPKRARGS